MNKKFFFFIYKTHSQILFLLLISFISCLLCLIPSYFLNNNYNGHNKQILLKSINTEIHIDSLVLSITACIIISFEGLLDYMYGSINIETISIPRWTMLISLFIPNLVMFIAWRLTISSQDLPVELFSTMTNIREIMFQSSLLCFHFSSSKNSKLFLLTIVIQVTFDIGIVIIQFGNFVIIGTMLSYFAYLCIGISAIIIFCMLILQWKYSKLYTLTFKFEYNIYILCLGFNIFGKYFCFILTSSLYNLSMGYQSSIYNCIDFITVLIIVSIHGRKSREEYLLSQNQLHRKKAFVKYISHEIRTPLNTISLTINYLANNLEKIRLQKDGIELKDALHDLHESSSIAISTLNNILTLETLDDDELTLVKKEIKPNPLIESTIKIFKLQAYQLGINLKFEGPEFLSPELNSKRIYVDSNKISQVIRNLVSNALKFTKRGGSITIRSYQKTILEEISTNKKSNYCFNLCKRFENNNLPAIFPEIKNYLVIEVEDTGIGISEENCKQLFTRPIQFDSIDYQLSHGSGLGLMISKSIINAHDGKILVESKPNEGTKFTVLLECFDKSIPTTTINGNNNNNNNNNIFSSNLTEKCSQNQQVPLESESKSQLNLQLPLQLQSKSLLELETIENETESNKIMGTEVINHTKLENTLKLEEYPFYDLCLIVDDSALNRKLLEKHLKPYFSTIHTAINGIEAIKNVEELKKQNKIYNLICLDSVMPEMDGPTTIENLRQNGYSGLVVGVTGNVLSDQIESFKNSGVNDVLSKPLDVNILLNLLNQYHNHGSSLV